VYEQLGEHPVEIDATKCLAGFAAGDTRLDRQSPSVVRLEICTGRLSDGLWGAWKRGAMVSCERPAMSIADAHTILSEAIALRPDAALVIDGVGDPLMHHDALGFVQLGDELGFESVELRTDLLCTGIEPEKFIESGLGILSVDLLANSPEIYKVMTGQDRYTQVVERIEAIIDARDDNDCGIQSPWVVPRITRCDAAYQEIPDFYDRWLMRCGSAAIDPMPRPIRGQRLTPLAIPGARHRQIQTRIVRIQCDGFIGDEHGRRLGERSILDVGLERALSQTRRHIEPKGTGATTVSVA